MVKHVWRAIGVGGIVGMIILGLCGVRVEGVGADRPCADVEFVWARGSGQKYGAGKEWREYKKRISERMIWGRLAASYEFWEVEYPAVEMNAVMAVDAWVSAGSGVIYGESVRQGAARLEEHLRTQMAACPRERFVLTGYSQGAQVVAETLQRIAPNKVIYVSLLGEPKLYLPEGRETWPFAPEACAGKNLSEYRVWAPNCYTYTGALGARSPYVMAGWERKVGLYCNSHDFICGSSDWLWDNDGHTQYDDRMGMVAGNIFTRVARVLPETRAEGREDGLDELAGRQALMDTVFVLDSTGSMSRMIDWYKGKANELAEATLRRGGRVALVEYRDHGDKGYPRLLCDFSCSGEEFAKKIDGVRTGGGGDEYEGLLAAMMKAYNTLNWRYGAAKSLIVLTDTGYHSPDKSGVTYMEVVARSLVIDPVNTYIISERGGADMARLAADTGGKVFVAGYAPTAFLDEVNRYIVGRPVALLALEEYAAKVGESLVFDAGMSYGVGSEIVRYDWDFDGDGVYELLDGGAATEWRYGGEFAGYAVVRAVAEDGGEATMSAKVVVSDTLPARQRVPAPRGARLMAVGLDEVRVEWEEALSQYVAVSVDGVVVGYALGTAGGVNVRDWQRGLRVGLQGVSEDWRYGEMVEVGWEEETGVEGEDAEVKVGIEMVSADAVEARAEVGDSYARVMGRLPRVEIGGGLGSGGARKVAVGRSETSDDAVSGGVAVPEAGERDSGIEETGALVAGLLAVALILVGASCEVVAWRRRR